MGYCNCRQLCALVAKRKNSYHDASKQQTHSDSFILYVVTHKHYFLFGLFWEIPVVGRETGRFRASEAGKKSAPSFLCRRSSR